MKPSLIILVLLLAACAEMPEGVEGEREVVLQYLGIDAGTAGPFSKKSFREFDALSPKDRADAAALFDRGAIAFEVFQPDHTMRIVFLLRRQVVGDFRVTNKEANQAPGAASPSVPPHAS